MEKKKYWQEFFEKSAKSSKSTSRSNFFSSSNTWVLHELVRSLIGTLDSKSIIDVGCGDGAVCSYLTKNNNVYGIDYSPNMLRLAKANGLIPIQEDFESFQSSEGYDVVVSVEAITLADDPYETLCKVCQLIKPSGKLVLSVLNQQSIVRLLMSPFFRVFGYQLPKPLDVSRVEAILSNNGIKIEQFALLILTPFGSIVTKSKNSICLVFGNNLVFCGRKTIA